MTSRSIIRLKSGEKWCENMSNTKIKELVSHCDSLIQEFSKETNSFAVDVLETKNDVQWSMNYNIIKIQFVFTKREKLLCPVATLYCRIYLGKNDTMFFHIPELLEYLDKDDFKCYYFSYIESQTRLEACFQVLKRFFLKHYAEINAIAVSLEKLKIIKEAKEEEIRRLCMDEKDRNNEELLEYWITGFEKYVLLPRFAGEGTYREFLKENYGKAIEQYRKLVIKNTHISYEKRLLEFMENVEEPFEAISKECNSVLEAAELNGDKEEGIALIKGVVVCELFFGTICAAIIFLANRILASDTVLFYSLPWYWGFVLGGLPAIFGTIALRHPLGRKLQGSRYQKKLEYEALTNMGLADKLANIVFAVSIFGMLFLLVLMLKEFTAFYEERMEFVTAEVCYYKDLEAVIYSEGVYNDYGDYIDRPSYLLCFADGTVWDSDGYTSVEEVEEQILKVLQPYYTEIETVKSRNEFIE